MVRLCKPAPNVSSKQSLISNTGGHQAERQAKYVIIRKICPNCGEHSLRNDRKFNKQVSFCERYKTDFIKVIKPINISLQTRMHGYRSPSLPRRISHRDGMSAESNSRGSLKNVECDVPAPPMRGQKSPHPHRGSSRIREREGSLTSRVARAYESSESYRSVKSRDVSAPRNRPLESNMPCVREDNATTGPSLLEQKLEARSRRSSMTGNNLSSSRYSRSTIGVSNSSMTSVGRKSPTPSRRHSAEFTTSKSVCSTRSRGRSATSRSRAESASLRRGSTEDYGISRHSPSLLEKKLQASTGSSERSVTSTSRRSSMTGNNLSSSRYSRSTIGVSNSSTMSLGPKSPTASRRHSTELTSSKSVCSTRSRGRSVTSRSKPSSKSMEYKRSISRRHSAEITSCSAVCNMNMKRHGSAPHPSQLTRKSSNHSEVKDERRKFDSSTDSATSSEEEQRKSSGRSLFSSRTRGSSRCKTRNDAKSRGRSRSKPRDDGNPIFSVGRSFANSISRQRSLSRSASRVLSTTSTMDGGCDAEPCPQRYEVPFNPSTGACNYHPEFTIALKNKGGKGGWRIIAECCPKCVE